MQRHTSGDLSRVRTDLEVARLQCPSGDGFQIYVCGPFCQVECEGLQQVGEEKEHLCLCQIFS